MVEDFSLEDFAEAYVDKALFFLLMKRNFNLSSLELYVDKKLHEKFGISKNNIDYLRNYFHWAFFNGNPESPFEYIQPEIPGDEVVKVGARREINRGDKDNLINYIFCKYGPCFIDRFERVFNTSHQSTP